MMQMFSEKMCTKAINKEQEMVKNELQCRWDYYIKQLSVLCKKVDTNEQTGSMYNLGLCNIVNTIIDIT